MMTHTDRRNIFIIRSPLMTKRMAKGMIKTMEKNLDAKVDFNFFHISDKSSCKYDVSKIVV